MMSASNQSDTPSPTPRRGVRAAFTLIELLVVIAIIAILASLLLPALALAKEKAKVAKVHVELYGVGLALEMYADDHDGQLPPVRVNCNTDLSTHWCQFPVELAQEGYLAHSDKPGLAVNMEDVFNPGHTYKYAAPGPQLLNDSPGGNYKLWVPNDFPECATNSGNYYSNRADSPVRWVLWSLGPRPDSDKTQDSRAPIANRSWYRRAGDGGVIARMATRDGMQFKTP
jgi:prepilin-type N-terminal cleavage/methylation domain-containing protein